jgi:hypothetical protein
MGRTADLEPPHRDARLMAAGYAHGRQDVPVAQVRQPHRVPRPEVPDPFAHGSRVTRPRPGSLGPGDAAARLGRDRCPSYPPSPALAFRPRAGVAGQPVPELQPRVRLTVHACDAGGKADGASRLASVTSTDVRSPGSTKVSGVPQAGQNDRLAPGRRREAPRAPLATRQSARPATCPTRRPGRPPPVGTCDSGNSRRATAASPSVPHRAAQAVTFGHRTIPRPRPATLHPGRGQRFGPLPGRAAGHRAGRQRPGPGRR